MKLRVQLRSNTVETTNNFHSHQLTLTIHLGASRFHEISGKGVDFGLVKAVEAGGTWVSTSSPGKFQIDSSMAIVTGLEHMLRVWLESRRGCCMQYRASELPQIL